MPSTPFPILPAQALERLGERIAFARKARGLSQVELAMRSGIGANSMFTIEKGGTGVAVGSLVRVLDTLGLLDQLELLVQPENDAELVSAAISKLREGSR